MQNENCPKSQTLNQIKGKCQDHKLQPYPTRIKKEKQEGYIFYKSEQEPMTCFVNHIFSCIVLFGILVMIQNEGRSYLTIINML